MTPWACKLAEAKKATSAPPLDEATVALFLSRSRRKIKQLTVQTATMDFCVLHELVFNLCVFLALNSQNGDIVPGEVAVMGEEKDNLSSKKGSNSKLVFEQMTKKTQATEVCFCRRDCHELHYGWDVFEELVLIYVF